VARNSDQAPLLRYSYNADGLLQVHRCGTEPRALDPPSLRFSAGQPQFLFGQIGDVKRPHSALALNFFTFGVFSVRNSGKRTDRPINPTDPSLSQGFQCFKQSGMTLGEDSVFPHVTTPSLRETTVHAAFGSTPREEAGFGKF